MVVALVHKCRKVRAVSRAQQTVALTDGVEVAGPDLTPELFDGVDRAFVFPTRAPAAARDENTTKRRLPAAATRSPTPSSSYARHRAIEQAVTSRTDEWTILRPGTFANNLLVWAGPIRAGMPVRRPPCC